MYLASSSQLQISYNCRYPHLRLLRDLRFYRKCGNAKLTSLGLLQMRYELQSSSGNWIGLEKVFKNSYTNPKTDISVIFLYFHHEMKKSEKSKSFLYFLKTEILAHLPKMSRKIFIFS